MLVFLNSLGVSSWLEFASKFVVECGWVDSAEDGIDDGPEVSWLLECTL